MGYGAPVPHLEHRARLVAFGLALGASLAGSQLTPRSARAQVPLAPAGPATVSAEEGARRHFERALELYRAGKYALALEQLSRAAELDPGGKDLFFNQALVHEKLGELPQAIAALERYRELETEPAERERARLTIERLRGAEAAASAAPPVRAEPCPEPAREPARERPSANVALIGAGAVSVVALALGAVFGVKALARDVADARTGPTLSPQQLRERGRRAEREALVADVAFAVSAAAAGTFACVWLLAPAEPSERAAGITVRSYF